MYKIRSWARLTLGSILYYLSSLAVVPGPGFNQMVNHQPIVAEH